MFIVITPARNEADQVEELVNCMRNSLIESLYNFCTLEELCLL
jgi:hypothetical protein|tara:strand:+ start:896 stop:1024 length:129 start_codon:yes stop_codon:yes gene_type:complete